MVLIACCAGLCATVGNEGAWCFRAGWIATSPQGEFLPGDPRMAGPGDIRRGEQIFTAADCSSCHATPGQTDRLHLGGGLALASTFVTFRPPNIGRPD